MYDQVDKNIGHILSECNNMAQKEYKRRRNWTGRKVHWKVNKWCNLMLKRNGENMSLIQSMGTVISAFCGISKYKQTMCLKRDRDRHKEQYMQDY